MTKFLKVGAIALGLAMAAGCTDLKPLQAQSKADSAAAAAQANAQCCEATNEKIDRMFKKSMSK